MKILLLSLALAVGLCACAGAPPTSRLQAAIDERAALPSRP